LFQHFLGGLVQQVQIDGASSTWATSRIWSISFGTWATVKLIKLGPSM